MTAPVRLPRRSLRLRPAAHVATRAALLASALALSAAACADRLPSSPDASSPSSLSGLISENTSGIQRIAAAVQRDSARTGTSGGATGGAVGAEFRFPAALALTAAQQQQIDRLRAASALATAADSAAWQAIIDKARAARAAGSPASVIDEIIAGGAAIRTRLDQAAQKLQADILAVLTPAQREWLTRCMGPQALTEQQRQQLAALQEAFDRATAADMAEILAALREIEALRAGSGAGTPATEEQIRKILERVLPARERLRAAQQQLAQQMAAVTGTAGCEG